MGIGDARTSELAIHVDPDATITVDTGSRFVPVGTEDLERILDRLASDGGTLRVSGAPMRADDGDEPPDRESDPAVGAASWVLAQAQARGLEVIVEEA